MTFAYLNRYLFVAAVVALASPAFATEPKLDTETCNQMRLEHMKYVESGAAKAMDHGADWAKTNLGQDKLRDLELFIQLDEQITFGCRDAKLTLDAERAGEAAKRLELNPDHDPTAPLPVEGQGAQGTGDSDGTADASPGATTDAKPKVKLKPKAERHKKAVTDAETAPVSGPPVIPAP